ncbi:GAF domain-containing protein [Saccharopolyspora lacisalsi]|uniref:GAF domain-containing protein n=1 Tax=Halosaccharopolyspora lacisalsi TaxID=1000566 RepID=A0A839DVT2_9PSEU|nr:GAF and ANTAR domain-containing protein [Halosaccharopolyspora lacisalsi]MBA8822908.1 GAF domain-containing protein [Halosaccharopolyspora lacisalsi]
MLGFLLFTTQENLGALNLYSSRRDAFTKRSEQVGWIFASHAAVALASARNDAQLHEAIETRQGIGEAMGIIMNHYKLAQDQAFEVLKRVSQHRNVKLRDVTSEIIKTGEIPEVRGADRSAGISWFTSSAVLVTPWVTNLKPNYGTAWPGQRCA